MAKVKRLQPTRFLVDGCGPRCSLNAKNIGEERATLVHGWLEAGKNDEEVALAAQTAGFRLNPSSIGRHRQKHLVAPDKAGENAEMGKLSDVEALEAIIKRGQQFIPTWRITPTEYFKALDLYYKLTKGSAFDDLMSSFAAAANAIEDEDNGQPRSNDPGYKDVSEVQSDEESE